jgi:hypothetical protein
MLQFVQGKASERKLRLFAVACCRRIWHLLSDRSKQVVQVAERFAEGLATNEERLDAINSVRWYMRGYPHAVRTRAAVRAASEDAHDAAHATGHVVYALAGRAAVPRAGALAAHCCLLRDIINPFRLTLTDPAWIAWDGCVVKDMAQTIYEERAFGRLPILADALEDAGCTSEELLAHCREPGEHVRGCWAVDVLLGKE